MRRPRVLVLRTAGTNCDGETVHAWELAGARAERVHVRRLIERADLLEACEILTIPGGFSYGDDVSAGKILALQLIHHLAGPLQRFLAAGKLILGICNGFQVLVKAGLLPGSAPDAGPLAPRQTVTLAINQSARFEARWVHLKAGPRGCAFLPPGEVLAMPVAHGEGRLVAADASVRRRLEEGGHIALTYCDARGRPGPYPVNPNGSELDIAGLTDAGGRILGLMPHPERHVHAAQHPEWSRRGGGREDGRVVFETAVRTARAL